MMENTHEYYMQICRELADLAAAEGESPVGSIVVKDGIIIGRAFEKSKQLKDITRHAEVLAVLDAIKNHGSCDGATLYSNVEPCILCSYVIRHHKFKEIIFGKYCGELGGTNPEFNILGTHDLNSWGNPPIITVLPFES